MAGPEARSRGTMIVAAVVAILALLLVIGLLTGEGDEEEPGPPSAAERPAERSAGEREQGRQRQGQGQDAADPVTLQVSPVGETYVCVEDADGQEVFERTIVEPETFEGGHAARESGNTQVGLELNGRRCRSSRARTPSASSSRPTASRSSRGGATLHVSARAGIVVTGTEVLNGRVRDRNGPWLADRLAELGVELAHVTICGDRREDMEAQLRFMAAEGVDLIVTSGGLGPTADDLTLEMVADFTGRPLQLDERLEERIAAILQRLSARWRRIDPEAVRDANRKQALVPEGGEVIEPAGTAPGVVVPASGGADGRGTPAVVVMPGPPRELHEMWPPATRTESFRAAVSGGTDYAQRMLRLFGIPESELAATLREAEADVERFEELEITTCLRRGEVEAVIRSEPGTEPARDAVIELIADRHGHALFSVDGSSVDEQVAELLAARCVGVGESCTGGLMAARLTERPGASGYVAGGVVAYSDEAKSRLLGVDPALVAEHGAVSPEVAEAMADGVLARFGADLGIAITGVAGPGGGTGAKPVGYVCWCVKGSGGEVLARDVRLPGDRAEIRDRSTTVAMHLVRRLLRGEQAPI